MTLHPIKNPTRPSKQQLEEYLNRWESLDNYRLQESALEKLFHKTYPKNEKMDDILIKVASLNDFYSTNIFSIFSIARHIKELNIDDGLNNGDLTLVNKIAKLTINYKNKNFYSFASKYCSHHQPEKFPIYDSYVDIVLRYFKQKDGFYLFQNNDLKDYLKFTEVLKKFNEFYELETDFKKLDQYLWQLGREIFPKNYKK
jgi:hypothetical protein